MGLGGGKSRLLCSEALGGRSQIRTHSNAIAVIILPLQPASAAELSPFSVRPLLVFVYRRLAPSRRVSGLNRVIECTSRLRASRREVRAPPDARSPRRDAPRCSLSSLSAFLFASSSRLWLRQESAHRLARHASHHSTSTTRFSGTLSRLKGSSRSLCPSRPR
jgi:hypothetical protein